MPEGPTIVLLKEETKHFIGKQVIAASGTCKIDLETLKGKKIIDIKSWGKHLLICFKGFTIRIHFLMFGSYRINERKESEPRLRLTCKNGEMNFYTCAVKYLEGDVNDHYDWTSDVMNKDWDGNAAAKKLKESKKNKLICDALLEQDIFSGVGNIIKNEVLYRVKIHPESNVIKVPAVKMKKMIAEASAYSFEFLDLKRAGRLKASWKVHTKKICPNCKAPIGKKYTGIKKRRSFFCVNCQVLYS